MEFALTVRDNKAGGGQTSDDLMTVTVANIAPFTMSAPNTGVTWNVGQTQTVTWNVGSTNVAPVSCANVNILLSTDGGNTYPITLLANTPNDGSANITVPNNASNICRVMVEAADNIFYDISNTNFSIAGAVACNATVPTGLTSSNVSSNSSTISWDAVSGATYDLRHRVTGTTTWAEVAVSGTSAVLSALSASTQYEAQVRSKCPNSNSAYSSSVSFTTTGTTCTDVTLILKVDDYPEEISWVITDGTGSTVASGGLYTSTPKGATIIDTNCLPTGCYTFTINDTYGDGICCNYGIGSYELKDASGTILASGGSYGSSESTNFCVGGASASTQSSGKGVNISERPVTSPYLQFIYPNPVNNYLNVNIPANSKSLHIYNLNGAEVSNVRIDDNGVDVSMLDKGVYMIIIETEKEVIRERFIKN